MAEARFTHHMSDEDALMWNIEKDPILRSTILAVAIFDRPPDWNTLRDRLARTTRLVPRFRRVPLVGGVGRRPALRRGAARVAGGGPRRGERRGVGCSVQGGGAGFR